MNNAFELLVGSIGAGACWVLWFYFVQEQRLDRFREDLFGIRHELFCMAASGRVSFEDHSYRELRTLINGMIQFGHHISLRSSWIASKLSKDDPDQSSAYEAWKASMIGQPEAIRAELNSIHHRVFRRYMAYLVHGSILLSAISTVFILRSALKELSTSLSYQKRLSRLDIMDRAVNRIANSFDAKALEEQTYRDQSNLQVA